MKRVTLMDIAKEAGVSHGTVSNVLNNKGNVSLEKIKRVKEVANRLGYKLNNTARTLRSGQSNTICIILPHLNSDEYVSLYNELNATLSHSDYDILLYVTHDLQEKERQVLYHIAEKDVAGVVTISCLQKANDYYKELNLPMNKIIFVNRKPRDAKTFISFNFKQAGEDIKDYLDKKAYQKIGIFTHSANFTNERQFIETLTKGLTQDQYQLIESSYHKLYSKAFEFVQEKMDVIITSTLHKANILKEANFWGAMEKPPTIISLSSSNSHFEESILKYTQNYSYLGRVISDQLIEDEKEYKHEHNHIIIQNDGYFESQAFSAPNLKQPAAVHFLTIPSPTTEAIKKILPNFKKQTGIEVNLTVKSFGEIYDILSDPIAYKNYDLIRMDMAWFSWFAKKIYHPMIDLNSRLSQTIKTYQENLGENYIMVDQIPYAIPFDPSIQMLFYRKDIFEDQMVKRSFFEKHKKQLSLPKDYKSYNQLLEFFKDYSIGDLSTEYGASNITGRPEIIAAEFLSRYYAENGRLLNEVGTIEINEDQAMSALENYLNGLKFSQMLDSDWWDEAVDSFKNGKTAMIIVFMNHISQLAYEGIGTLIGYTSVPGGYPLLGGGVVGITNETTKLDESISLLNWFQEDKVAEQIVLLGGISANNNIHKNQMIRTLHPWIESVNKYKYNGIRETISKTGQKVNLREIEQHIGNIIKIGIENGEKSEDIIKKMSRLLKE